MVIEAAKGGHTQVVKLLLEYPNRMLMNTQQDLPQITANESHLVEVCMMHFTITVIHFIIGVVKSEQTAQTQI